MEIVSNIITDLSRFTHFLTKNPSTHDLLLTLKRDFLAPLKCAALTLYAIGDTEKLEKIESIGEESDLAAHDATTGTVQGMQANLHIENVYKDFGTLGFAQVSAQDISIAPLAIGNAVQGMLVCTHEAPVDLAKSGGDLLSIYSSLAAIYLAQNDHFFNTIVHGCKPIRPGEKQLLSPRQIEILKGMVEGKTNHELALDLGFSVSTIRHETMAIYKVLVVSDRKEAAKAATASGLI